MPHQKKEIKSQELQAKCDEYLNGWKRALADYENLKKQTTKDKEEFVKFAHLNFVVEILPVYNHLKMSLAHLPAELADNNWVKGVAQIKNQLAKVLADNGLEEIIPTVGEEFNPELHEAIENGDEKKENNNKIVKVFNDGYKLHGRVIVPARVVVE